MQEQNDGMGVVLVEVLFWALLLLCPPMVETARQHSGASFIRALIPFMRGPPYDLNTSQKPHLLMPSHWGLGFQHINFGGTQTLSL